MGDPRFADDGMTWAEFKKLVDERLLELGCTDGEVAIEYIDFSWPDKDEERSIGIENGRLSIL